MSDVDEAFVTLHRAALAMPGSAALDALDTIKAEVAELTAIAEQATARGEEALRERDEAQTLASRLDIERDELLEELSQALARGRKLSDKAEKYRDGIAELEGVLGKVHDALAETTNVRIEWHWRDNDV